jgi:myo-inositol-1(or 4)-monophosphatase
VQEQDGRRSSRESFKRFKSHLGCAETDMPNKYIPYLTLATEAAKKAGQYLLNDIGQHHDIVREEEREIHFCFDLEAEKIIINELQNGSAYKILTEESGLINTAEERCDYSWIVDPLDGSINYSEGIPLSCVSVSLWKSSSPVLGVIYDFNRDHIYTGVTGLGAWMNNHPIRVKPYRCPAKAIICTGFPASMDLSETTVNTFINRVKKFRKIRMIGSAALSLAFVASGKVDAYYEKNIKIWDVAAGLALVKAAGGEIICKGFPDSHVVEAFGGASLDFFPHE